MALADAADGRVAAHRAHGLDVVGQQQRARAGARGRERRLGAGALAPVGQRGFRTVEVVAQQGLAQARDFIERVERGIYVVGDKSWSIDMQRYNFQFTGQRFFRIKDGKLDGQVRDVAYQATTTDFWAALEAVGGQSTWRLGGAFNCGKAQPGQVAAVSHGCPSALFRGINVLNTREEGGR